MASAFSCDLCSTLEAGATTQKITVAPAKGQVDHLELCSGCLVSFNDWRVSRAPEDERPTGSYA